MKIVTVLSSCILFTLCIVRVGFSDTLPPEIQKDLERLSLNSNKTIYYSHDDNNVTVFNYDRILPLITGSKERVSFEDGFLISSSKDSANIIRIKESPANALERQKAIFDRWSKIVGIYSQRDKDQIRTGDFGELLTLKSLPDGSTDFIKGIFGSDMSISDGHISLRDAVDTHPENVVVPFYVKEYFNIYDIKDKTASQIVIDQVVVSPTASTTFSELKPADIIEKEQLTGPSKEVPVDVPKELPANLYKQDSTLNFSKVLDSLKEANSSSYFDANARNVEVTKFKNGKLTAFDLKSDWINLILSTGLRVTKVGNVTFYSRSSFFDFYKKQFLKDMVADFLNKFHKVFPERMNLGSSTLVQGPRVWNELSDTEKKIVLSHSSQKGSGHYVFSADIISNDPNVRVEFGLSCHMGLLYEREDGTDFGLFTVNDRLSIFR